jgi:uncharacterized protein (TIGR03435 family)
MIPLNTRIGTARIVAALLLVSAPAAPQEAQSAFDVTSVKRDVSGQPGPQYRMFPEFSVERATVKDLIKMAYEVQEFRVTGGPGWINSDRYNIETKSEGKPVFSQEYRSLLLRRLQTLLRDRFQLSVHRETKELPVYELTVAKGGPKLQPPNCIQREPGDLSGPAPGKTMMDYCGFGGFTGRGEFQASNGSTGDLAGALSPVLGRSIIDKSGVAGRFRILLKFSIGTLATPDDGGPPADSGPDIFTAFQEQLGLKLEAARGPVEVIVIDRVEKPSEN